MALPWQVTGIHLLTQRQSLSVLTFLQAHHHRGQPLRRGDPGTGNTASVASLRSPQRQERSERKLIGTIAQIHHRVLNKQKLCFILFYNCYLWINAATAKPLCFYRTDPRLYMHA